MGSSALGELLGYLFLAGIFLFLIIRTVSMIIDVLFNGRDLIDYCPVTNWKKEKAAREYLESLKIPDENPEHFEIKNQTLIRYIGGSQIVKIPDGVKIIGAEAFMNINGTGLKEVYIPNSVTTIDERAFYKCTVLSKVYFGNNIKFIGKQAFYETRSIEELSLPLELKHICYEAFYGCGVRKIWFPPGLVTIADECFSGCGNLCSYIIPENVQSIGENAFNKHNGFCSHQEPIYKSPYWDLNLQRENAYHAETTAERIKAARRMFELENLYTSKSEEEARKLYNSLKLENNGGVEA